MDRTEKLDRESILSMAMGAITERADYEMSRIIDNILDANTNPTKKCTLALTIDLTPDSERRNIRVTAIAKSKLEPTNPVATSLYLTSGEGGEMVAVEMTPQIPGQINVDGAEQEPPKILKLVSNK